MTKKEIIWRDILHQAVENKKIEFTQKDLAKKYGFSLSTVFNALKIPRKAGIINVSGKGFKIEDIEKFLYLWATVRNLNKDVFYQTNVSKSVREIEGEMLPEAIFGAFSSYFKKYREAPADYDKVYIYMDKEKLDEIKKRFPPQKGYYNLNAVAADDWLKKFGDLTPDVQTFVDFWNLPEWYAKDFLNGLKEKIL